MDCRPLGSSVHGILQARMLEWVALPFSRGSSQSRDWNQVSCIAGKFLTIKIPNPLLIQFSFQNKIQDLTLELYFFFFFQAEQVYICSPQSLSQYLYYSLCSLQSHPIKLQTASLIQAFLLEMKAFSEISFKAGTTLQELQSTPVLKVPSVPS